MFADIFFFHAQFFKLYPPDSANDLTKKELYWVDGYKKQKEANCPNTGDYHICHSSSCIQFKSDNYDTLGHNSQWILLSNSIIDIEIG